METIPTPLIEKALALTGKKIEDMQEPICLNGIVDFYDFSIEKFCYYLLSQDFINGYCRKTNDTIFASDIGEIIFEFQRRDELYANGNPEPLIQLLSKI